MENHRLLAKTFAGLENTLAKELNILGAGNIEMIKRGIRFEGDKALMYKVNYLSRLALRVLKEIAVFEVPDEDALYEQIKKIPWTEHLYKNQTFVIHTDVFHSNITHSQFASLKAKDAIADHYREKKLTRPSVNKEHPDVSVYIHISQNVCSVSLDSSGDSLHKRGYKIAADKAPLNEVLAAGLIQLSGWDGSSDFYDPMCGSGTIPIEAAMQAMNIPAGYYRESFGFQKWLDFDEEMWKEIKTQADAGFKDMDITITASDRSEKAIQIAAKNLKHAGLHKDIVLKKSYFDALQPLGKKGTLIFNPPYGMRLQEKDIVKLYKGIGDVLKTNWSGHQAWVITSETKAAKFIGLHPSKKIKLYNGPKEALFLGFDIYEGSKKEKKKRGHGKSSYGKKRFK